ncbi:hypothetical protein GCM10028805_53700 [Spirosoma harenae]
MPKKGSLAAKGAIVAIVDVYDTESLRAVFQQGQRLFALNPPAPVTTNTTQEERKRVQSILAAVADSGLERIVVESTYGAQPGDQMSDLGVLYGRWDRWPVLLSKLSQLLSQDYDFSAELTTMQAPTLLVYADGDSVRTAHVVGIAMRAGLAAAEGRLTCHPIGSDPLYHF